LFQGLNAKEADEIFTVLIKYLLAATDETPEEAEEKVKHLPKGGETVRTTAEVLREEGYHKAIQEKPKWIEQGELKNAQEMLIKSLKLRFDLVKPAVKEQIRSIQSVDTLNDLFELSFKCSSMEEFTERLNEVAES
jgi:hypothetical protein